WRAPERCRMSTHKTEQDECLHCAVMAAMEDWHREHGDCEGGVIAVDASLVVAKLSECVAEVINRLPDRGARRRALRFAHEAIDASVKAQRNGELVEVAIPVEH